VILEFQNKNPHVGSRGGDDEDNAESMIEDDDEEIIDVQSS
jgi:hypothetical protein